MEWLISLFAFWNWVVPAITDFLGGLVDFFAGTGTVA
jgi:hypothetical protein